MFRPTDFFRVLLAAVLVGVPLGVPKLAADEPTVLSVGDPAPQFEALDDSGNLWKSRDHVGKQVLVVYFYPADMTGGCTAQACNFRDDLGKLKSQNVKVIGVSGDSVKNHQLFKTAHQLNFPLLADTEGKVADAFGVPKTIGDRTVTAVIDGQTHQLTRSVTTKRWTFVIDMEGKIIYKDENVNARQDSQKIQELLGQL